MKGIIYSLMNNYYKQNSLQSDYHNMAVKLFDRHVARGWSRQVMKDYILSADLKIRSSSPTLQPSTTPPILPTHQPTADTKDRLFLHMEYHSHDIPKHKIRDIYEHTCQDTFSNELGINQFTICYSLLRLRPFRPTLATREKFVFYFETFTKIGLITL